MDVWYAVERFGILTVFYVILITGLCRERNGGSLAEFPTGRILHVYVLSIPAALLRSGIRVSILVARE